MVNKDFCVYSEKCPSRNILQGISDKWSILVLSKLAHGTFRFGELKREIGGVSPKILTQTLKKLERIGLLSRTSFLVLPLKVEYELTSLCKKLSIILQSLTSWTEKNMEKINEAEKAFINTKNALKI